MRKLAVFLSTALVVSLLAGCESATLYGGITQGSGKVISESRAVSEVHEVVLTMSGNLTIEQKVSEALTIEAEDNILPLLTTEVHNGRLTLGTKPNSSFNNAKPINFRLTVKDLSYIGDSGSGNITMQRVTSDQLTTDVSGSGSITLNGITASSYAVKISGSGGVTATGQAANQTIALSGSGPYDGKALDSKNATVSMSGSGDATVRVSTKLEAHLSGSGSLKYIGSPTLTQDVTGSGKIQMVKP
jgi:hypothetical protein